MSGLKLYYDLMSQPSRAVFLFLKVNGIPFTEKPIAIRKGENEQWFPIYCQLMIDAHVYIIVVDLSCDLPGYHILRH